MLSLNLSSIIFTVINLLVLVYFVHRFLFKPVRAALKARQDELDTSYREAEEANTKARDLKQQYEDSMAKIDTERLFVCRRLLNTMKSSEMPGRRQIRLSRKPR